MKELILVLAVVAIIILAVVILLQSQLKPEKEKLIIKNFEGNEIAVDVELANNFTKRAAGLMFRDSLPEKNGMLFVFDNDDYHSFWMLNTRMSLEAIFISSDGNVVDIIEMEPCKTINCKVYRSGQLSRYVLEVNSGFSTRNNIRINNSKVKVMDFIK